jgi:hypothetical protein
MTSIPLSVKSTTRYRVRGQMLNYEARETGSTWLSPQRHTYAPHMRCLLVDSASSSNQVPSLTKIFVSFFFYISFPFFRRKRLTFLEVDLAAELGIPNVPRGESESTKSISVNVETRKAEELFGLTRVIPLKDMVATGGGF